MFDVVVVGAGVMGGATAYWLSRAGKRVALLDKYSPGHVRASSADESRMVRYQYRGQTLYTEMVAAAVELWKDFDRRMGTSFYREQGALALQAKPDNAPFMEGYEGLLDLGYQPRWLDAGEVRRRYPQFTNVDSGYLLEDLGGYVAARPATQALAQAAAELGADVLTGAEVTELGESGGRVTRAITRDGRAFEAEVFVIAAGPWTPMLLPELSIPIRSTAERLHYLTPPDPDAYSYPRLPPFFVMDTNFYGFPVHWRGCVKVAEDTIGATFDPDREREHEDPEALTKLRDFLRRHMPDLSKAEVVYSKTCTYSMTPDTDFVIDHLPDMENAIVAAGFSGHGFKFGILIGQILADLAVHGRTRWDLTRFRLDREPVSMDGHW
ncbi:MAG: N-methyl-L-tryptophan oxidase [Chloroflexi bacterium]|nr:N-methyl-L-tryptophan oxidase [Chloroflexota bacterium]